MKIRMLPRNRLLRFLVRWIAVLGFPLLVLLSAFALWVYGSLQLSKQIARIRAAGGSVTWADVVAKLPARPTQEQGTRLLQEAFDELKEMELPEEKWKLTPIEGTAPTVPPDKPLPPDVAAAIAERVAQVQPILEKLRRAAPLGARFWNPPARLGDLAGAHLSGYRACSRLFALSALHNSSTGHGDAAVQDISTGLDFISTLETDPTSLADLTRSACVERLVARAQDLLARSNPSTASLHGLAATLLREEKFSYKSAVDCDRPYFIMLYDMFTHSPLARGLVQLSEANQLETLNETVSCWDLDWDTFEQRIHALSKKKPLFGFGDLYERLKKTELKHQALVRCVRTGVCAELFRRAKSRLPGQPSDLVPDFMAEVPKDPYTGKPLAFEKDKDKLVIYCPSVDEMHEFRREGSRHCFSFTIYEKSEQR